MVVEKTVRMGQLFSMYSKLLTKKQREMFSLYYDEDFSLSEIAEHYDISRQGVYDNIRRGEKALEDYEALLQLNHKREERLKYYKEIKPHINKNEEAMKLLKDLIEKDE